MFLTGTQTMIMILAVAAGTIITRVVPFIIFPEEKEPPKTILYLGKVLPAAMMGLLVIYCVKEVSFISIPYGAPELISIVAIIVVHKLKNNVLLSIGGGTLIYMILIQCVFA